MTTTTVTTSTLLQEIEQYWSRRASSYSDLINTELATDGLERWLPVLRENGIDGGPKRILDVGTGPGFFAIALASLGHEVVAVDYTEAMLEEARANAEKAGVLDHILFLQMDAQDLTFPDDTFDFIVTRNVTWVLEHPDEAYVSWHRVLKQGGTLLNFDAGWYNYLFDEEKYEEFLEDRENVRAAHMTDSYDSYDQSDVCEEFSKQLMLSRYTRPEIDLMMLDEIGFSDGSADRDIWQRVWNEEEKMNGRSTPLFLLKAVK